MTEYNNADSSSLNGHQQQTSPRGGNKEKLKMLKAFAKSQQRLVMAAAM